MIISTAENTAASFTLNVDVDDVTSVRAEFSPTGNFRVVSLTKTLTPAHPLVVPLTAAEVNLVKDCHFRILAVKNGKTRQVVDGRVEYDPFVLAPVTQSYVDTTVATRAAADPVLSNFSYDPATGNLLSYKEDGVAITLTYNADGTVATSKRGSSPTKSYSYAGGNLVGVA